MSVPVTVTRVAVEAELVAATAWANRHGWVLHWHSEPLILRAASYHPTVGRLVEVTAHLEGYRALPPAWRFVTPGTDQSPASAWPAPGQQAGVAGSIFHPAPCICAPWNRLAYSVNAGPHDDWAMTSWPNAAPEYTKADYLADMLDQILQHLHVSPGLQA